MCHLILEAASQQIGPVTIALSLPLPAPVSIVNSFLLCSESEFPKYGKDVGLFSDQGRLAYLPILYTDLYSTFSRIYILINAPLCFPTFMTFSVISISDDISVSSLPQGRIKFILYAGSAFL